MVEANRTYYQHDKLRAMGLAFPGGVINGRYISEATNLSHSTRADWKHLDLAAAVGEKFQSVFKERGLGETLDNNFTVTIANDLVAGALGERHSGAARDMQGGWLLTTMLGTGYGGATMLVTPEGGIVTPGEPGQQMATKTKSIEDFVSGTALLEEAQAAGLNVSSPRELIANAFLGGFNDEENKIAQRVINKSIRAFADSLAGFVHYFYVPKESGLQKRILIGGGVVEDFKNAFAEGVFLCRLKEALAKKSFDPALKQTEIAFTHYPDNLTGAAVLATLPTSPGLQVMG